MTAKEFFKSTSFKCIAVLLSILLICGILLTICNSLFEVTREEELNRAVSEIYGKDITVTEIDGIDEALLEQQNAEILEYYKDENGDYLIKSKGLGGYNNGSVTCWVVVEVDDNAVSGIYKVVIGSNEGQSYIDRITDSALGEFSTAFDPEKDFSQDMITGATTVATKTAICNSVNGAMNFVRQAILGESAETIYDDFMYADFIDKKLTTHKVNADGSVSYHLTVMAVGGLTNAFEFDITVSPEKTISEIVMTVNGSTYGYGQDAESKVTSLIGATLDEVKAKFTDDTFTPNPDVGEIFTGASLTGTAAYRAAAFALANYDNALANAWTYADFIDKEATSYTVADSSVSYHLVITPVELTNAFEFDVVVSADKTIASITMTVNGSTYGFGADAESKVSSLVGATLDDVKAKFTDDTFAPNSDVGEIFTGASLTGTAAYRAAAYALANYDLAILLGGNA